MKYYINEDNVFDDILKKLLGWNLQNPQYRIQINTKPDTKSKGTGSILSIRLKMNSKASPPIQKRKTNQKESVEYVINWILTLNNKILPFTSHLWRSCGKLRKVRRNPCKIISQSGLSETREPGNEWLEINITRTKSHHRPLRNQSKILNGLHK
jgi:hypothetical protein